MSTASPTLAGRLRAFFLDPVDPRPVGWMRISLGLLLIATHFFYGLWLDDLFGPEAVISMDAIREWRPTSWSPYELASNSSELRAIHAALYLPLIGLTVGFRSRTMCLLAFLVQLAYAHRIPLAGNGGDRLLRFWCLYMMLVPSGAALSVDAWMRAKRKLPVPKVPIAGIRLIQIQLCIMYTFTGLAKAGNHEWWDGSALGIAMAVPHFMRFPELNRFLLQYDISFVAFAIGTWTTLIWELLFIPLVLWRRGRRPALGIGLIFHVSIWVLMTVGVFAPASVWAYQAFLLKKRGDAEASQSTPSSTAASSRELSKSKASSTA